MKKLLFVLALLPCFRAIALQTVNPVIGDRGWQTSCAMMTRPSEKEKVSGHLQFVESYLRMHVSSSLNETQNANRLRLLDALHAYSTAGKFPANEDYPGERKPHFIDCSGTICAVGYLVEVSAGRAMAERINEKFSYNYIAEMHDASLAEWMRENGLTAEECAMIQPTYGGSSGPSLKDSSNDSLGVMVARNIKYNGKPDSCVIKFQVNQKGKLYNDSVVSGNAALGKAILKYMNTLEYTPYRSWSWHQPENSKQQEPEVRLRFAYGIKSSSGKYLAGVRIVKDPPGKTGESIVIEGTVKEKSSQEPLENGVVIAYGDSGKQLAASVVDMQGNYKLSFSKPAGATLRLELSYGGLKIGDAKELEVANQHVFFETRYYDQFEINDTYTYGLLESREMIYLAPAGTDSSGK